jgi:hypothetical protein
MGTLDIQRAFGEPKDLEGLKLIAAESLWGTSTLPQAHQVLSRIVPRIEGAKDDNFAQALSKLLKSIQDEAKKPQKYAEIVLHHALPALRAWDRGGFTKVVQELAVRRVHQPSIVSKNLDRLSLIVNLAQTIASLDKFHETGETSDAWDALKSGVDNYDDLSGLVNRYALPEIEWSRGIFKGMKLKPVALLTGSVDCVFKAADIFSARNSGAKVAAGVGTLGAMVGLASSVVVAGTGVGLLLMFCGFVIDETGEKLAEHYDDLNVFLRNSFWGQDASPQITSWSDKQPLAALKQTPKEQERAFIEMLFGDFSVDFTFEALNGMQRNIDMAIKFDPKKFSPPTCMKWSVSLRLDTRIGSSGSLTLPAGGSETLAQGKKVRLAGPYAGVGQNQVRGTVTLDVHGDGMFLIKKPIEERTYFS